jgi:selenocysteine lyase/cysteine desulfurase
MTKSAERFRDEFPMTVEWAYLNHASTGGYPQRAIRALEEYAERATNPAEYDTIFNTALMQETKERVARLTNSRPELVAFVPSLADAMNLFGNGLDWRAGDNVLIPIEEFPSVTYPFLNLRKRYGIELRRVGKNAEGRTDLGLIEAAIDARTRAVALSHVEWSDGYRNDLHALGRLCKARGVELFVDATQSLGAQPIDVPGSGVTAIAAHAYKWLLAGHGLAPIVFADEAAIERIYPTYAGIHSVESVIDDTNFSYDDSSRDFPFKPGAERYQTGGFNKLSMTVLHSSLSLVLEADPAWTAAHTSELVQQIADGVTELGYRVVSDLSEAHRSQIVAFTSGDVARDGELVRLLEERKVAVCQRPKGIRVAPYFYNTAADVERLLESLPAR